MVLQKLIDKGQCVRPLHVDCFACLGTVHQMLNFFDYHATRNVSAKSKLQQSSADSKEPTTRPWPQTNSRKRSRIAFDLEDTLFLAPLPKRPQAVNPRVARMAREMHDQGHTIIIQTSRKGTEDNRQLTFAELKEARVISFWSVLLFSAVWISWCDLFRFLSMK